MRAIKLEELYSGPYVPMNYLKHMHDCTVFHTVVEDLQNSEHSKELKDLGGFGPNTGDLSDLQHPKQFSDYAGLDNSRQPEEHDESSSDRIEL